MEQVILVDEDDRPLGLLEKMEAHRQGKLHRAFSIVLFNSRGELLLQKRASAKYHSGGLWTNTCCSHPQPGETMSQATRRKLKQEMGIDLQPEFAYTFLYKVALDNDLWEHELDHVYTGIYDGTPDINPDEVEDWKFIDLADLRHDMATHPDRYTHWFKIIAHHPNLAPSTHESFDAGD